MPEFRIVKEEREGEEDLYIVQRLFLFIFWCEVAMFRDMYVTKDNYLISDGLRNAKEYIEKYKRDLKPVKKIIVGII